MTGFNDFDTCIDRSDTLSLKWEEAGENELPMWVADMDFDTAPAIKKALAERLERGVFGYSIIPDEWKEAYIGWWEKRHGFLMEADWLIFTTGVIPALSTAVRKFTYPAEKIVVMSPVYNIFYNSIINNGRRVLESELLYENGAYRIDWEGLEELLIDPLTTMLILCNPHNPCGNIWTEDELKRLAEMCLKHHVLVFSDEIHCDLLTPGIDYHPFLSVSETAKKIGITAIAPSKAFNIAGLSTACVVVADEGLRERMDRALNTDEVAEPNVFAIQAAIAAFTEGGEWLDELRNYLAENRKRAEAVINALPGVRAVRSDATYLLWIDCTGIQKDTERLVGEPSKRADKLAMDLRKKTGLILSGGVQYGKGGDGFLRMNLACPKSLLEDGLARFKKWVEER